MLADRERVDPVTAAAAAARAMSDDALPPVLLTYQQRLVATTALADIQVVVYEKSRRIGVSWAAAEAAVETSASTRAAGGMDTLYIGYNLDMARGFIGDCADWARHLGAFAGEVPEVREFVFEDGEPDKGIKAFRIDFASGFEIVALSSRPRSLRGKQGFVIVDEAAFHDQLDELIKAAMALLIWGGRVWFVSTHDGADNPFAQLVEDARSGRKPYTLFRTTFADAVADGLYRRICLVSRKVWSPEAEAKWVAEVRGFYGDDADEELDVIPRQGSGVWLSRALIEACMNRDSKVLYCAFPKGFEFKPAAEREAFVEAWLESVVAPELVRLDPQCWSFLGGDLARSGDLSVIMPGQLARHGPALRVPFTIELRNGPFAQQRQILWWLLDRLPLFMGAAIDANGIGAQIAEETAQRYGEQRVAQIKPTLDWYRETMPRHKARFEDATIELPFDRDTIADYRLVRLERGVATVPANARTRGERGQRHGDAAMAGAMLEHASAMDPPTYGYTPAPRAATRADEPDDPDGGRRRMHMRAEDADRAAAAGGRWGGGKGAW